MGHFAPPCREHGRHASSTPRACPVWHQKPSSAVVGPNRATTGMFAAPQRCIRPLSPATAIRALPNAARVSCLVYEVADNVAEARKGHWNKVGFSKATGLKGRTLGLIGLGNIGTEMIQRARAFGMPVVAWSRSLTEERANELDIARVESPLDVARVSDIVSLHVASNANTRHLVDEAFLAELEGGGKPA